MFQIRNFFSSAGLHVVNAIRQYVEYVRKAKKKKKNNRWWNWPI